MKKKQKLFAIVIIIIIVLVLIGPFYVIDEGEQAVIVRMGKVINSVNEAGLYMKVPFIDDVVKYPKKIMAWNGEQKSIPTREKQYIWVDVTARWKISDPLKFYESIKTVNMAYEKLGEVIDSEVKTYVEAFSTREGGLFGLIATNLETLGATPEIQQCVLDTWNKYCGINNRYSDAKDEN